MSTISEMIMLLTLTVFVVSICLYGVVKLIDIIYCDYVKLKYIKRHADKGLCMCGLSVYKHGSFENHCIVSEWDYYVDGFQPSLRG